MRRPGCYKRIGSWQIPTMGAAVQNPICNPRLKIPEPWNLQVDYDADDALPIMIKLLVIDDHAVVREGIKHLLAETPDIEVAGEAANAEQAMRLLGAEAWDLALLDISMPDGGGAELLTQMKLEWPELPVLIISMHAESRFALPLMRAGADGYLQKEAAPEER